MRKYASWMLGCVCFFLLLGCLALNFLAKQDRQLLGLIRELKPGTTKAEALAIVGLADNEVPLLDATEPHWFNRWAPIQSEGEYLLHFLGKFPCRYIVVFFNDRGEVVFCTWAPT